MIGIAGMSHLGLVTAAAIAQKGFDVVAYDPDENRIAELNAGRFPVFEPGLPELLEANRGKLEFVTDPTRLKPCQLVYVATDVPTDKQNHSDLGAINALVEQVVAQLYPESVLVIHSQVPPGYTRALRERLGALGIELYYQVETLVFGNAIERALAPERIIIGSCDPDMDLAPTYRRLLDTYPCKTLNMRYESAELAKISINLFLIASVTTANLLAEACEKCGADWNEIVPALKLDKRIGPHAYLAPGLGISGGNLERDLVTLRSMGSELGFDVDIADAYRRDSEYRKDWVFRRLQQTVFSRLDRKPVIAIWGLAYKAGTRSTKNSPALRLVELLEGSPVQAAVRAYDPQVDPRSVGSGVVFADSAADALRGADVLVVMTGWEEFRTEAESAALDSLRKIPVVDPMGFLSELSLPDYHRIGKGDLVRRDHDHAS